MYLLTFHSVYLKSDGTVWAAGYNWNGRLGDGTSTHRSYPVQVLDVNGGGLSNVVAISAGDAHTVYSKSDGTAWATGYNESGQLGDGSTLDKSSAVQVDDSNGDPLAGVVAISAANRHTVYLKSDGTVWSVGKNNYGQLGDGTTTNSSVPVQVLKTDGSGLNEVVEISANNEHSVYLTSDGTAWSAGRNNYGKLGDGSATNSDNPVQVMDANGIEMSGIVGISTGNNHSVFLKSDGTTWAVGANSFNQLGDGSSVNRTAPVQVVHANGSGLKNVTGVSTIGWHTVYSRSDGTVWATGHNNSGQLGDGTTSKLTTPAEVVNTEGNGLKDVVDLSAGHSSTAYLKEDGTVWAFGANTYGQLGDGTTTDRSTPVQVMDVNGSEFSGVIDISRGAFHTVYIKEDSTVWAVGRNNTGQLGDGSTSSKDNPIQVTDTNGIGLSGVVSISTNKYHSVYLKNDGTVWATGPHGYGRLGNGETSGTSLNPVQVIDADGNGLSNVVGISAGLDYTMYVKSDRTAWASGRNNYGQLGDGTNTDRNSSIQVMDANGSAFTGVVGVSAAYYHTLFLKIDGTVWATGHNGYGRLGDGTVSDSNVPVQVLNSDGTPFNGVVGISASAQHSVFLKSDGTVWSMGITITASLGTVRPRTVPTPSPCTGKYRLISWLINPHRMVWQCQKI